LVGALDHGVEARLNCINRKRFLINCAPDVIIFSGMSMKRDLKQVILLRRDMRLRRAEAAALASKASMAFVVEGDESEQSSSVKITLSGIEAEWILGASTRIILGVTSEEAMRKLLLKAEIQGVSTYEIMGMSSGKTDEEGSQLIAASLGPDEGDKLDLITGNLKLF